jgi:hypothetical protein
LILTGKALEVICPSTRQYKLVVMESRSFNVKREKRRRLGLERVR